MRAVEKLRTRRYIDASANRREFMDVLITARVSTLRKERLQALMLKS